MWGHAVYLDIGMWIILKVDVHAAGDAMQVRMTMRVGIESFGPPNTSTMFSNPILANVSKVWLTLSKGMLGKFF